ncbi:hypothetical protein [Frankia sp. ACN1ag]|uniref:hypothetical protein n=1 Tax=Frankia sp. ACN1ag TaxID=102891 RepID=UPI00128F015B|nr:hypothetical protein [Frankia sp. ACN1ag]
MALWGLFGGFAVEGLDLYAAVRRHGRWPWQRGRSREAGPRAYLVAELVRLAIGAGLAAAAGTSGQITTPFAALAVGVAAPLVVERLSHAIPLEVSAVPAPADRASLEPDVVSAGPAGSGPRMGD